MNITIKGLNNQNEKVRTKWFPIEEEKLQEICNELGIEMTIGHNCYIADSNNIDFMRILPDRDCNIDELNYLMKRLDGFGPKELNNFMQLPLQKSLKQ